MSMLGADVFHSDFRENLTAKERRERKGARRGVTAD